MATDVDKHPRRVNPHLPMHGFTLLELCIVISVVGLIVVGSMSLQASVNEHNSVTLDQARLAQAQQALLSFAVLQHRLPCPDAYGKGWEGDSTGTCEGNNQLGTLPYITLGLDLPPDSKDRIRYGVYRQAGDADLVVPTPVSADDGTGSDPTSSFSVALTNAAQNPLSTSQPFVPSGASDDCSLPSSNVAFGLSISNVATSESVATNFCFAPSVGVSTSLTQTQSISALLGFVNENR